MGLLKLGGRVSSLVEFGHSRGYQTINTLLIDAANGQKLSYNKALIGRSDIMVALQEAQTNGDHIELYIEKPFWSWLTGGAQIFGIKTPTISHFDSRNRALILAGAIPAFVVLIGFVGAIVGSMISGNGFFELWFMTMMLTTAFVPPLWFGVPLALIATAGVLAKRINRQKAFYGTNPDEARRLKALEPVSL